MKIFVLCSLPQDDTGQALFGCCLTKSTGRLSYRKKKLSMGLDNIAIEKFPSFLSDIQKLPLKRIRHRKFVIQDVWRWLRKTYDSVGGLQTYWNVYTYNLNCSVTKECNDLSAPYCDFVFPSDSRLGDIHSNNVGWWSLLTFQCIFSSRNDTVFDAFPSVLNSDPGVLRNLFQEKQEQWLWHRASREASNDALLCRILGT